MQYMMYCINRKSCIWVISLVAVDQLIKLLISRYMMYAHFTIIPYIFTFRISQNIHLGWIWNRLDFMMPLVLAVLISVIAIITIVVFHRYLIFLTSKWCKYHRIPYVFLILGLSVGVCKIIDDIFWGGSLDYIQLFNWFIFDLKDVYAAAVVVVVLYFLIAYEIDSRKLSKEKRKEQGFLNWIKHGLNLYQ